MRGRYDVNHVLIQKAKVLLKCITLNDLTLLKKSKVIGCNDFFLKDAFLEGRV
jgi:hypothetical protein